MATEGGADLREVIARCIAPWHGCYGPEDWCFEKNCERADTILGAIAEAGLVIVEREPTRTEARRWAAHFAPCVVDDNNWYRGESDMDGKDAAELGEFLATLVAALDGPGGGA